MRNVYWSGRGVAPGSHGSAFLFGHTYDSQPSGRGVFDYLKRVHRGNVINVDKGGVVVRFKVTKMERAPLKLTEKKMAALLSHLGPARMAATTCLWNPSKGKYTSRLIVYGKMVQPHS